MPPKKRKNLTKRKDRSKYAKKAKISDAVKCSSSSSRPQNIFEEFKRTMSANVQTSLGTSDMPTGTNVEFLESFHAVDEDKDSDEESFHLFLDADDDQNKMSGLNGDGHKEEKDKVHVPIEIENSKSNEDIGELDESTIREKSLNIHDESVNSNEYPMKPIENEENSEKNSECQSLISDSECSQNSEETGEENSKKSEESDSEKLESDAEKRDEIVNAAIQNGGIQGIENEGSDSLSAEKCNENPSNSDVINSDENESNSALKERKNSLNGEVNTDTHARENQPTTSEDEKTGNENEMKTKSAHCQKSDENSVESSEDLLDISLIKDSEQDDADIAEDERQLQEEKENYSSTSPTSCANQSSNAEQMEIEISDEDAKSNVVENSENEANDEQFSPKKCEDIESSDDKTENEDLEPEKEGATVPTKAYKRSLSDSAPESNPKKLKQASENQITANNQQLDVTEIDSLMSFSRFMTKTHLKKLTRTDLEEFCVQKLCESILHKSELGESNHQLKLQEQTIDALRKDQAILTKRIRDLEVVNNKLIHEMKNSMSRAGDGGIGVKPIVPVKITRSVGLQVRMTTTTEANAIKRKPQVASNVKSTKTSTTPDKSPTKQSGTILSQMLQKRAGNAIRNAFNDSPGAQSPRIPSSSPEKRTSSSSGSGSFIDLTDEDDRKTKNNSNNSVRASSRISNKNNVLPAAAIVSPNGPQVMYVVQPSAQLKSGLFTSPTGVVPPKTVLVNFQTTSNVLPKVNNGSAPPSAGRGNTNSASIVKLNNNINRHPAPLPNPPVLLPAHNEKLKGIPPKPVLSIRKTDSGIVLQWRMPYDLSHYENIASYQLYAYQETNSVPSTEMWRKVGDVKAIKLPMACTLTQFANKNKYYFAVRPVDIHMRIGKFSNPEEISLESF